MSLLLDALKRAAEQKAAKSKRADRNDDSGPDTALDTSSELASADSEAEDSSLPGHRLEDETELDHSQLDTRLRRVRGSGGDSTETGLEVQNDDDSSLLPLAEKLKSGEDETLIFAEDDAAEAVDEDESSPRPADDETGLGVPASGSLDASGIEVDEIDAGRLAEDETDLSRLLAEQDQAVQAPAAEADAKRTAEDETDLSQLTAHGREAATADASADDGADAIDTGIAAGDETDLRLPGSAEGEDEELQPLDAEKSDFDLPPVDRDEAAESDRDERASGGEDTGSSDGADDADEDLSLLLIEREPTQITSPRTPQEALQSLQAEAPTAEEMGLVERTQHRAGDEPDAAADTTRNRDSTSATATTRNRAGDTATTGIATATANLGGAPRPDPSATQTYAPDNYDRTLMRLPNDEASKFLTGMQSDSDVVMTPDYAKQVFRSKSSAIRMQHAKIYSGIAIAILLAIGVYGIFEYQSEAENIEVNLRPLKNDPLPGGIRPAAASDEADPLFAEAEVNQRALEILQSAEEVLDEPENVEQQPVDATEPAAAQRAADGNEGPDSAPVETTTAPTVSSTAEAADTNRGDETGAVSQPIAVAEPPRQVAVTDSRSASARSSSPTTADRPASSGSRLQIETGERLEEKQVLLREAYDAFRAGDDALALQRYNRVLEIDPGNRNALLARGAINVHNGNGAEAIEDYQTLLLANPKDSLAMASLLAVANVSPLEAESQLKLMIRDEPESPHLNFALANAYAAQDRWQEAQRHYFTALQNNPDDPNYAYNLAVSLEHISQPQAAVSYYRRALENYNKGLATFSRDAVGRRLEKLAKS